MLLATECINNLITCHENLEKTHHILPNVQLPYCPADILSKILQMTDQLYTDMNLKELQVSQHESLEQIRQRCCNLKLWFDSVISSTLVEPYAKLLLDYSKLKQDLRKERIRLMHDKIMQVFGKDINLETLDKLGKEEDANDMLLKKTKQDEANDAKFMIDGGKKSEPNETFELPPPPSKEQLLGMKDQSMLMNCLIDFFNTYSVKATLRS